MIFISRLTLLSMLGAILLNSCTSLTSILNSTNTSTNTAKNDPEYDRIEQPTEVVLTAVQQKAESLKALPNLYNKQAVALKSDLSTATLNQFQQGLTLKEQAKYSQAKELFIVMSEKHPNLSGIWLQLGLVTKAQGKQTASDQKQSHKDTARYLNNAISANSLNYLAHNELAQVLRQQGQFQQALAHYELALKSWPAFALGYLNRGILYDLYLGKKSLALADYELYQALSNDNSRQLKGWIIDLQRQIKRAQQIPQTGVEL